MAFAILHLTKTGHFYNFELRRCKGKISSKYIKLFLARKPGFKGHMPILERRNTCIFFIVNTISL